MRNIGFGKRKIGDSVIESQIWANQARAKKREKWKISSVNWRKSAKPSKKTKMNSRKDRVENGEIKSGDHSREERIECFAKSADAKGKRVWYETETNQKRHRKV